MNTLETENSKEVERLKETPTQKTNKTMYGLTYDLIEGKSRITSVTVPNGQVITLSYTNGILNATLLTNQEAEILNDAAEFFDKKWKEQPKEIINAMRKGINKGTKRRKAKP